MKQVQGWWLPDEESHIEEYFKSINAPAYQPLHQQNAVKYCQQFRTAVDIGAHVGLWAQGLTDKFDKVICFEPNPEFAEILLINAPKVSLVHQYALGEQEGFVQLEIEPENTGSTHIARGATGSIPMKPLDHFDLSDVDFVKIDVEGYELEVVRGGYETFKRNSPVIIVEQKPRYVIPEQGSHAAVKFLLKELNYRVIDKVVDDWILRKL